MATTIEDLYDGALDDEEIGNFVQSQIDAAKKAVDKITKKKPQISTNKSAYLEAKKKWEGELREAERKAQYWNDVKAEVEKITTPADERTDDNSGSEGGKDSEGEVRTRDEGSDEQKSSSEGSAVVGLREQETDSDPTLVNVRTLYQKGKDYASKIFNMKFFDFATTPDFMKHLGMTGSKFTIRYGVIARHFGKDGSHDFTQSEWEQIPHAIEHPFAVTQLKNKEKGFRIYTALKTEKGEYVVVGVDVKNAGRDMEVNAIATMFGRRSNANLPENEEVIYKSKEITPEQEALLSRPNSDQYPAERESSDGKVKDISDSVQENGDKSSENEGEAPLSAKIEAASADVNTDPTEAQKEAGNYKKGHVQVGSFDIKVQSGQRTDDNSGSEGGKDSEGEVRTRDEGSDEQKSSSEESAVESGQTVEGADEKRWKDPRTMSDEEKERRGQMLRDAQAIDVAEGTIVATPEMSARKAAEKWWQDNVSEPVFYDTEAGEVEINSKSIEDSLAHRYGQAKLDAITSLVDGFENAVYLGSMQDFVRQEGVVNHYFAYPITYKGERSYVFCRAMQDANKNRLYVHEVFVADKIKKGNTLQTAASQPHGGIALYRDILANVLDRSTSDGKGKDISDSVQENGDKSSETKQSKSTAEEKPFNAVIEMLRKKFPDASMEALTAADRLLREQALPGERQKAIEAVAKALGLKVEWRDTMEKENGTFNPKTRTITIARDSEHALANTFGHEVTHAVRNLSEADYKNLKDAVRRLYSSEKEYNEAVQAYGDMYTGLDFDALEEELIADNIGFMIGGRNDMTQELASRMNHRVLWAIHDAMNKVRNALAKVLHIDSKKNGLLEALDSAKATIRETMANAQRIAEEKGQGLSNESGSARQSLRTQDTAIRDALVEHMRLLGMDVITDEAEGQWVLDMENGEDIRAHAMLSSLVKATNVIRRWLADDKRGESFTIELPKSTQRMIRMVMGRNFKNHKITANNVAHAYGNHGVGGKKITKKSIPLTKKNMELMPYIIVAPDYVRKGSVDQKGNESIRFYKTLSNGYVVVVEKEQIESPHGLESITMWAEQSSSNVADARHKTSPAIDVRSVIISTEDAAKIRKDAENAIAKDQNIREQRVYHGSGAEFDHFDHGHMGEGQGSQVFGWGTYVTSSKAIGESYAQDSARGDSPRMEMEYTGDALTDKEVDLVKYAFDGGMRSYHETEEFLENIANSDKSGAKRSANALALLRKTKPEDWTHPLIGKRQLCTVEIPEDNGSNYLAWKEPLNSEDSGRIISGLFDLPSSDIEEMAKRDYAFRNILYGPISTKEKALYVPVLVKGNVLSRPTIFNGGEKKDFGGVYRRLQEWFGSDEAVSKFLSSLGYSGIKYPAGTIHGGAKEGDTNYVIFNEKDVKITDHVRFFRTANGEAYGFTVGGKIYIDPKIATSETPIHEYAHLWATALKSANAKEWQNVVGLMKGTKVWDEVKALYPELKSDDEIADEVLATYSGRRGAERLREEQRRIAKGNGSVFEKAEAISALERVKQALKRFWKGVADFLHIHYTSAEEVADRVMKDLLDGVDPRSMMDGGRSIRPDTRINVVEGNTEHGFKNYAEAKDWAKEKIARTYNSEETGGKGDIRISNAAINKYLSQSAVDKSDSKDVHLSVLKVLPEVIRESVDAEQHADFKKGEDGVRSAENGINPNVTIHRLYGAVRMGGRLYRVKVTLKEDKTSKEPKVPHSYEATKIELFAGTLGNSDNSLSPNTNNSITAAKLLKGVEKSYGGGKFFEDYNKVREQFIGEQGAERADHAEEVTTRIDNLNVAREMEDAKKDAKAIKMATGWERGADGKWRYEIPDLKYFSNGYAGWKKARARQPWIQELDALSDKLFEGEDLSDSEMARFDELAAKESAFKAEFLNREKPHLADWVENDELFKAYPDLKRVNVVFTDQLPTNVGGSYNEREHTIVVNTNYVGDIDSVLAHEVQHAIQKIEGFARGGNPESIQERFKAAKKEWRARAWADELRYKADEMGEHYNQAAVEKALIDEYKEMGMDNEEWMPDKETRMKGFNYFARGYADRSMDADIKNFRLDEYTRADFSPYEEYTRLGGEVESRNVEARMGMSAEERRASLAAETEDISREKQIFLFGEGGTSMKTSSDLNEMFGSRWLDEQTNDDGRHTTQVKSTINSYKKFVDWVKRDSNGRDVDVLDASSGLGLGTAWMRDNGFKVDDVEPFPSDSREAPTFSSYDEIDKKYDYIISNAVLNVIPDDWRANVLHQMADKLKDGGKLVINVRGAEGIRKQGIEGKTRTTLDDASEILVHRPDGSIKSYQKGFTKSELKEWCEKELGEGYSVEIANNKNAGGSYDTAVVVTKREAPTKPSAGHREAEPKTLKGKEALAALDNIFRENAASVMPETVSSLERFKDLFRRPIRTFLGELVKVKDEVWNKILRNNRQDITGTVLPTIENADFAIRDTDGSTLYVKRFESERSGNLYNIVVVNKHGEVEDYVSSVHIKRDGNLRNKIKNGAELFLPQERNTDGTLFRNNSTPAAKVVKTDGLSQQSNEKKQSRRGTPNLNPDHIAQAIYEQSVSGFKFDLDEAWHDSLLSVKRLQEAISETRGVPIRDFENVYWHAVALSSVNAAEMEQLMNLRIQPFIEAVQDICKKHDLTQEDIEVYLNCKHGLERNEAMARRDAEKQANEEFKDELRKAERAAAKDPLDQDAADALDDVKQRMNDREEELYLENREKDYSGLTDIFDPKDKVTGDRLDLTVAELEDEAKKYVKRFEAEVGVADVTKLWDNIHELNNYSLRKSYLSGLISKSQYDSVKQMYQWYVPHRGFNEEVAGDVYTYVTRGETRTQQLLKEAKGRTSRAGDILATMMNMANSAVNQGNRNLMKQKILNLALNAKNPLLSVSSTWYQTDANGYDVPIEPPINDQMTPSEQKDAIEQWENTMKMLAKQGKVHRMSDNLRLNLRTQKWQADEHCIRVQRGGKEYCVWVNGNPRAAQALNDRLGNQVTKPYKATETILDKAEDLFTDGFMKMYRYIDEKKSPSLYRGTPEPSWNHNNSRRAFLCCESSEN